ncbi:MAG: FAD:protein FMN transferase [Lachnospiraceae bacterium]|nr:FAD:protein FMN transferase [Lachnospiraceae bacterium]
MMKERWKRVLSVGVLMIVGITIGLFLRDDNKSVTKNLFAMDTYMELTAYGRNSEEAVEAAVQEIQRLDALLSTGSEMSEVTIVNREKKGSLSEDYAYLLKRSMELWKLTDGAFDITVYPLMQAWGFADKKYRVPSVTEIESLLTYVDTSKISYDETTNEVVIPEQAQIDFGGIAKGYTSSMVAQIMKKYHIQSAMFNLGGNVQTVGTKADGSLWRIAIKSPYDNVPYLGVISIAEKAVITSGGYERYFEEDGIRYHHIINPKTGMPVQNGLVSVTIICEDGTMADGLSTSLFVMGKETAISFWKAHSEMFDMILCDEECKLYVTEGIKECFSTELEYEIISKY